MTNLVGDAEQAAQAAGEDATSKRSRSRQSSPSNVNTIVAAPDGTTTHEHDAGRSGTKRLWLSGGILVIVIGVMAALAVAYRMTHPSALAVTVFDVTSGPVLQTITASGLVVSKKRVEVTSPLAGTISNVLVKQNDTVRRGQTLATLDETKEKVRLAQAELKVKNAQSEVATTQHALEAIMAQVTSGVLPTRALDDAGVAVESSRAYLQLAREELQAAQLALERHAILAPFDGLITAVSAKAGMRAESSGSLFTLVDPHALELEFHVEELQRAELFPGLTVTLTSSALADKQWTESVVRVIPASKSGAGGTSVTVVLSLTDPVAALGIGQTVEAQFRVPSQAPMVQVPPEAIGKEPNGRNVAAVVVNGKVHYVAVTIGATTPSLVEVREGLSDGQQILMLQKMSEWPKEGTEVTIVDHAL